jgi:hypothetical protein
MREIQELTMQAVAEATRIEATISGRREKFLVESAGWFNRQGGAPGGGLQILGLPTIPIDLVRVVNCRAVAGEKWIGNANRVLVAQLPLTFLEV